jgi:hypothetical protein
VRLIIKVGVLSTKSGKSLMLAATIKENSAISNFCSTLLQVVGLPDSLHAARCTPIKDRP